MTREPTLIASARRGLSLLDAVGEAGFPLPAKALARRPRARDAGARSGSGLKTLGSDRLPAPLAAIVGALAELTQRASDVLTRHPEPLDQRDDLLALERDGGAFRVVLVVRV